MDIVYIVWLHLPFAMWYNTPHELKNVNYIQMWNIRQWTANCNPTQLFIWKYPYLIKYTSILISWAYYEIISLYAQAVYLVVPWHWTRYQAIQSYFSLPPPSTKEKVVKHVLLSC